MLHSDNDLVDIAVRMPSEKRNDVLAEESLQLSELQINKLCDEYSDMTMAMPIPFVAFTFFVHINRMLNAKKPKRHQDNNKLIVMYSQKIVIAK